MNCVMCKQEFNEKELDWCGRCEACFRKYMSIPDGEKKPNMGVPWSNKTPPGA